MAKEFVSFKLEEFQSLYETTVDVNLADSGCHPVKLSELVDSKEGVDALLDCDLHYPAVGGTTELRDAIADFVGISGPQKSETVLVTVGAAEANAIAVASLVKPGDNVLVMSPGYQQISGLATNIGAKIHELRFKEPVSAGAPWTLDLNLVPIGVRFSVVAVNNPNNPLGRILNTDEMRAVVEIAKRSGAWLLSDEVYRGSERTSDEVTPSFWSMYDKVVCVGSLSKAFGLPGLRVGWLCAHPDLIQSFWRRHEYLTISTGILSMHLATIAVRPATRARLFARNRQLVREGYKRLEKFVTEHSDVLEMSAPDATALGFVRFKGIKLTSEEFCHEVRKRASVLVAPGAHFGAESHFRITHGVVPEMLEDALGRLSEVVRDLQRGYPV
ncbi:aminotransferase [Gonapodya prolifera JEL478]|uniref:Aminotransferase n=1 Tax=Gonapodya prolifera (strain JEL478) TaxID=1344416 RepID=A0A139AIM4_GONPJ|nr:aminotransferase [Gonapodya prolifera JEL478]|eukprot:KXS16662.1 aminotransferase [Gonapodya prolifera JEL478]